MNVKRVRKAIRSFVFTYLVFLVSRSRRSPLARALSWATLAYQKAIGNCSFNMRLNGERRILEVLAVDPTFGMLFDVGANHGEWAHEARHCFPSATIHCFELAPPTFAILQRNVGADSRVVLNNFGLADDNAKIQIPFIASDDGLTSMLTPAGTPGSTQIDAEIRTGDEYMENGGLAAIDFMKIDVEGAEPFVFAGFERALAAGVIRVIQFEYGHARCTLREFYEKLEKSGYIVGKIYPDACAFDGYRPEREPIASNYVAVLAKETNIIALLSGAAK